MANPEVFITQHQPPENVWWCAERQCFIGVSGNHKETLEYQNRFTQWQSQYDALGWAAIADMEK